MAEIGRPTLIDVQEGPKEFQISADLPGVRDAIKVHVEGDVLSLAVEKATDKQVRLRLHVGILTELTSLEQPISPKTAQRQRPEISRIIQHCATDHTRCCFRRSQLTQRAASSCTAVSVLPPS